jgi:CRP-like cAMP-binding protein
MKEAIADLLIRIPLFRVFKTDELIIISEFMNPIKASKGKILFQEGDKGDYICFVIDGRFDVMKRTMTENKIILNTLSRGRSFGEMAIIEDSPRSATVKARTKASLITLTRKDFDLIMEDHPKIGVKILKGICLLLNKKLRTTSSRLAGYMQTNR